MELIVQLDPDSAHILQTHAAPSDSVKQLNETIAKLGVRINPQHAGETDAELSRYFVIQAHNKDECDQLSKTLSQLSNVTAAYCKPEAEIP